MHTARSRFAPKPPPPPAPVHGPCSRSTPRCMDAKSYGVALRDCCRAHIRQIVAEVVPLLEQLGIRFWADYGTLLGAVRNPLTTWADYPWLNRQGRPDGPIAPGIIPHDKDADFGVFWTDWPKMLRLQPMLEAKGYSVLARRHEGSMKVRLSAHNFTNLDLFTWRETPGPRSTHERMLTRTHYIGVDRYKGRDFSASRLEPMASVEWEGMTLPAPNDPPSFCAFRYGPNWRTPVAANHDGVRRG